MSRGTCTINTTCRSCSARTKIHQERIKTRTRTNSAPKQRAKEDADAALRSIPSTQELLEEMEVVWDWNSPKREPSSASVNQRKRQQQQQQRYQQQQDVQSPKLACSSSAIKRKPSSNQIESFRRFKEELIALKNDIACQDEASALVESDEELRPSLLEVEQNASFEQMLQCCQELDGEPRGIESSFGFEQEDDFESMIASLRVPEERIEERVAPDSPPKTVTLTQTDREQMERNRLQAVAKLEARKQRELMEKKRLEALKRLEQSRKRRRQ